MIEITNRPTIDAKLSAPYKAYRGRTSSWIATTLSSIDRPELWQKAYAMCDSDNRWALFNGVTADGAFVWNTGVGMWVTN